MRKWCLIGMVLFVATAAMGQHSHYGQHMNRTILALSEQEMQGLLNGEGMGMALVAELSNYPGPRHVLDLADSLQLTENQQRQIQRLFDEMHREAVKTGKQIVEKERQLQQLLQQGNPDKNTVEQLLTEIGHLRGLLRWIHIRAHLRTRPLLSAHQIHRYNQLRGYHHAAEHPH